MRGVVAGVVGGRGTPVRWGLSLYHYGESRPCRAAAG
jgi:hypothetical protein